MPSESEVFWPVSWLNTPRLRRRNFRYAVLVVFVGFIVFIVFIVAAVLTPSTDPVNHVIMAGPMLVLYGVSIAIAWIFQKRDADELRAGANG